MVTALFVADPIDRLKPAGDSTLCVLREALQRKVQCFWTDPSKLWFEDGHVFATASKIRGCAPDQLPETTSDGPVAVAACNVVFLRKDPPFDADFVRHLWLLALEERNTLFVNRPSLLLRYHEKLLPWEALASGDLHPDDVVPTYCGPRERGAKFVERHGGNAVEKPFFGFGGKEVHRFDAKKKGTDHDLLQPFVDALHTRGDRRVMYVGGEIAGHIARFPKEGSILANLAQGGRAERTEMTPREAETAERLGGFLGSTGFFFSGADLLGHQLTEVNVTSPTGIASLQKLGGEDVAAVLWDALEKALAKK